MYIKKEDSGMWDKFRWFRFELILVKWLARYWEFSLHEEFKFLAD